MLEKEVEEILTVSLHTPTLKDPSEQKSTQLSSTLEHLTQKIVEEIKNTQTNLPIIRKIMQTTFAVTDHSEHLPTSERAHGV